MGLQGSEPSGTAGNGGRGRAVSRDSILPRRWAEREAAWELGFSHAYAWQPGMGETVGNVY